MTSGTSARCRMCCSLEKTLSRSPLAQLAHTLLLHLSPRLRNLVLSLAKRSTTLLHLKHKLKSWSARHAPANAPHAFLPILRPRRRVTSGPARFDARKLGTQRRRQRRTPSPSPSLAISTTRLTLRTTIQMMQTRSASARKMSLMSRFRGSIRKTTTRRSTTTKMTSSLTQRIRKLSVWKRTVRSSSSSSGRPLGKIFRSTRQLSSAHSCKRTAMIERLPKQLRGSILSCWTPRKSQ